MNALIDTCVIIDSLANRMPFAADANMLFAKAGTGYFRGYLTAKSATDVYYIVRKYTHSDQKNP